VSSRTQNRLPRSAARTARTLAASVLAAAVLVPAVLLTTASAATAAAPEGLGEPGASGLSGFETFLLFVGIPIATFVLVYGLVYATSRNSEPRLREGESWWAEPEFHSTGGAVAAPGATDARALGASRTTDGGGTSGTW
jgi:hypothetical protein